MFAIILLVLLGITTLLGLILTMTSRKNDRSEGTHQRRTKNWRTIGTVTAVTSAVLFLCSWLAFSYNQVAAGNGAVVVTLGKVELSQSALKEGPHWLYPWQSVVQMSARQISLDRHKANGTAVEALAGDSVTLNMDASFFWMLSYDAMPYIYQKYGTSYWEQLQVPSAASTFRDVIKAKQEWDQVLRDKEQVEDELTTHFSMSVTQKLTAAGLPENIVSSAFVYPKMALRRITPPEDITTEINLKKAANEKEERKTTEIRNAALDAQKRGMDGTAIRQIILRIYHAEDADGKLPADATLPANLTADDISNILNATARKQMADAAEMAAEKGQLGSLVMMAGETPPAAVTAK